MREIERNTLEDILLAAKSEFLSHGYQAASLRTIAAKADATTGALYGYFRNKEELFEALVGEQYNHMLDYYHSVLSQFAALPPEQQCSDMMSYTRRCMQEMKDYMYANYDAFKLILCCSEGTRYNHLIHEAARMNVAATHDFAHTSYLAGRTIRQVNPTLEHMLTSGMFATFFELIIHDVPAQEADEYIEQMLAFYQAGWVKLMGL